MSSVITQVRVPVCLFTFADGRRCRTPRSRNHVYYCFFHARKEAHAKAADGLGHDLTHRFSGNYHSACELTTALGRIILAVVQGQIDPKTATAVGFLSQTILQAIPPAQKEYLATFGQDSWTNAVQNSVNENHNYLYPPAHRKPAPTRGRRHGRGIRSRRPYGILIG